MLKGTNFAGQEVWRRVRLGTLVSRARVRILLKDEARNTGEKGQVRNPGEGAEHERRASRSKKETPELKIIVKQCEQSNSNTFKLSNSSHSNSSHLPKPFAEL